MKRQDVILNKVLMVVDVSLSKAVKRHLVLSNM